MIRKKIVCVIFLIMGILGFQTLFAASFGEIVGVVADAGSGEPLTGANVYVQGTSFGAATDLKGNYRIERIPSGTYDLKVTYIGYKTKIMSIRVEPNEIKEINFQLDAAVVSGQTVTITAQAEGQMAAINQQITARNIKNVVAADRIQEIPDVNAAESLGRLPGVSILRSGGKPKK